VDEIYLPIILDDKHLHPKLDDQLHPFLDVYSVKLSLFRNISQKCTFLDEVK